LTAKINGIDSYGLVIIEFSSKLKSIGFNISFINSTVLDLKLNPAALRNQADGFNESLLNFTWKPVRIFNQYLELQVNFTHPLSISPLVVQDQLIIEFKDAEYFYSSELNKTLHRDSWKQQTFVKKQMKLDDFSKGFQSAAIELKNMMNVVLIFSIALNIFTKGAIAQTFMLILIRSLQIVMHLPMLQIIFPANVIAMI